MHRRVIPELACLILLSAVAAGAQVKGPRIEVSIDKWDFGTVDQGTRDEVTADVFNRGDQTLRVGRVGVTCGCVEAEIDNDLIEAGGKARLLIKLDSARQTGPIAKHVFLDTNDREHPKVLIGINGVIKSVWWVSVSNINFGMIDRGKPAKQVFRIVMAPQRDVKVTRVSTSSGHVSLTSTPFGELDKEHGMAVEVTVSPESPIGRFQGRVVIETDFPMLSIVEVPIEGHVLGSIFVAPDRLLYSGLRQGSPKTVTMKVNKRDGDVMRVERVTCTDPQITSAIREVVPGKTFEVDVTYTPKAGVRWFKGQVCIWTDDPVQKLFTIDYTGNVAD